MAPRIRSIHPGLFTDEAFMSISATARVFLMGIWCQADDRGVFEWKPITLKARLFPADAVDTESLLSELENVDVIKRFEVNGRAYGVVRNFGKYQRPRDPKAVHPLPDALFGYAATDGTASDDGPMNYSRDVTAAERQRRKRARDRDRSGSCHGSNVTNTAMSRQMEDEGGRVKEEGGKDGRSANADSSTAAAADPLESRKSSSKKLKAAAGNSDDVTETYRCWNLLADHFGLPKATRLTDRRKTQIRRRLKAVGGIEAMKDVMRSIHRQAFLLGDNDRGWKLSIDSFLQPSTFTKIQEGSYVVESNRHSRNGKGAAAVLAGVARAFGQGGDGAEPEPDMEPARGSSEVVDADWSETQLH
ncbi:MAG: hypothetical protein ACXIVD_01160 [Salinarimonas sp.]